MLRRLFVASALVFAACPPGGETDAGVTVDSGTVDAGELPDAGEGDAGSMPDAGAPDASIPDSGTPDAGLLDAGSPGDAGVSTEPLTFRVPSPAGVVVWTTPVTEKVLIDQAPPTLMKPELELSAAKNEYETLQVVLHAPARADAHLSMTAFTRPGAGVLGVQLYRVGYVAATAQPADEFAIQASQVPETLTPRLFASTESIGAAQNLTMWLTLYVPRTAAAGDYTATLYVSVTGGGPQTAIPVKLHVYDFVLPGTPSFDGKWTVNFAGTLADAEQFKDQLGAHRLTPATVAWPAGYPLGAYDCASQTFPENPNDPYDIAQLGPKYIDGAGWNADAGFSSFEAQSFITSTMPRPSPFCGTSIGPDPTGSTAYNTHWTSMLQALQSRITQHGWLPKTYVTLVNEPGSAAEYDLAASLVNLTKTAAPNLRVAVVEQPRPEIAESRLAGGKKIDLWMSSLPGFEPKYARTRQALGEQVWWYFLPSDEPPLFSPVALNHPGVETRVAFWAAASQNITGFAYYDADTLFGGTTGARVPGIRAELLREGAEDYEYLKLARSACPSLAASASTSLLSFTRSGEALKHLRDAVGRRLEGSFSGCPRLTWSTPNAHARAEHYLNFQDPAGQPSQSPLIVNGHAWTKVGAAPYSEAAGLGWVTDGQLLTFNVASTDPLQSSGIYDDFQRRSTFAFDLANGLYTVTVSIGRATGTYPKNRVVVEGQTVFDDVATNATTPHRVAMVDVVVNDGSLTLELGAPGEYTMLNWLSIVPK